MTGLDRRAELRAKRLWAHQAAELIGAAAGEDDSGLDDLADAIAPAELSGLLAFMISMLVHELPPGRADQLVGTLHRIAASDRP
jgi:hypothetical protein